MPAATFAGACLLFGQAQASVATFDTLSEGVLGTTFTDGGITFSDLDDRAGGFPVPFTCERADGTMPGPGFSPPNALGFGSWVPGPDAAFSQIGSFRFTTGTIQTSASIDVFEWGTPAGNFISLEAYRNGLLVRSTTVQTPGNWQINHWHLHVSGAAFDTLRINGTGPHSFGTFIGLVDNVVVIPAPPTALALTLLALHGRRR
ncbi:MAG: hypothetical protein KJZ65_00325 [Phycisphaerales bacterium]|nr:hypothetical protein [Phycisphaerales bacterium]